MKIEDAVEFIRMEYAEMPGLKLTFWQLQRLLRLSHEECAGALKVLTSTRYLIRTDDCAYVRWSVDLAAARGDSGLSSLSRR